MAIAMVGTVQAGTNSNGNDVTLTFDGTPAEGDVVYVLIVQGDAGGTDPAPSTAGYTQIDLFTGGGPRVGVHRKVLGATPDSGVVCQGSGDTTSATAAVAVVLRGVDNMTPEDADATTAGPTTSINPDCPPITTVTDGAWVLALVGADGNDTSVFGGYGDSVTAHATDTERANAIYSSGEVATAGTEDPDEYLMDSSTWYAVTVAVRPDTGTAADPANLQASVDGSDVTYSWDASF